MLIPGRLNGYEYLPLSRPRAKRFSSSEVEALRVSPSGMVEAELEEGRVRVESKEGKVWVELWEGEVRVVPSPGVKGGETCMGSSSQLKEEGFCMTTMWER